ncbi:MAG: hypothetical protein JWQ09_3840 [Segetibacter sp.]|nr:hypothetical protein [Segetibacter sp.]
MHDSCISIEMKMDNAIEADGHAFKKTVYRYKGYTNFGGLPRTFLEDTDSICLLKIRLTAGNKVNMITHNNPALIIKPSSC